MNKTLLLIFAAAFMLSCSSPKNKEDQAVKIDTLKQEQELPNKELPNMLLTTTDGTKLFAKELSGKKVILVFFQPDCDHCQVEGREIKENAAAFKEYSVYFVSSSTTEEIKKFSEDLKLNVEKNFYFSNTDVQSILDNFGSIYTPSVYIYSQEGKLLNTFNGQTNIDNILKAL